MLQLFFEVLFVFLVILTDRSEHFFHLQFDTYMLPS